MNRSSRVVAALILALSLGRRLRRRCGDPQEHQRAPSEVPEDRRDHEDADPRRLRAARRHRPVLHRRAGQLHPRRPARRHQDARQPHRRAHRQADRDRLQVAAPEGRDGLEAGHRREKAGRLRRSQLRLLQEIREGPAGGQGRHRLHLPLSDPRRRLGREVEADLVREGQHQGLARLDAERHDGQRQPAVRRSALQRNYAFGQKHRIRGTPGLVFEDGRTRPAR